MPNPVAIPPFRRTMATALALLLATTVAARADDTAPDAGRTYQNCVALADNDPAMALEIAEGWLIEGGGLGAGHCEALALSGLGRYAEAARQLEELAETARGGESVDAGEFWIAGSQLLAELYAQAGNAWLMADRPDAAHSALSQALIEAATMPGALVEIYVDRARASAELGRYDQALADLDAAWTGAPDRAEIGVLRANAFRNLGRFEEAAAAIEEVLARAPDHPGVLLERGNLRITLGDDAGAEADWRRVADLDDEGPDGAAAVRALMNLTRVREDGLLDVEAPDEGTTEEKAAGSETD